MLRPCSAALAAVSILSLVGCGSSKTNVQHLDPATWCDHVAGGPSGTQDVAIDLSAAHAGVRFFGAELDGGSADVALANALDAPDALTDGGIASALNAYKAPLMQVCVMPANDTPIGPVQVQMQGAVAVIHPGTGDVVIPSIAAAVAIDLRDLPNREDLEPVLEAAVAPALAGKNSRGTWSVQDDIGLPPELPAFAGFYGTQLEGMLPTALEGTAAHDLPLAVITGPRMAYPAAELAADLRLATKAWIIGEDVRTAVAESCWQGVGDQGIAYRCRELKSGGNRWADAIPADFPTSKLDSALQQLPSLGIPGGVPSDLGNDRPAFATLSPAGRPETSTNRLGDARAALLTAHGAARLFYPYFATVGDTIDARLVETLGSLGATPDRATTLAALQRFSEALVDGQAFAGDGQNPSTAKLPLVLEQVNAEPVVRASGDANVHPGDRITVVDGTPFADWYAAQAPTISASTEAFRLQRAFDRLISRSSATLTLVDVNGVARDVTVAAQADSVYQATRKGAMAASGIIPGTNYYYLNADGSKLDTAQTLNTQLQAAATADGLVLDVRGVPAVDSYLIAGAVLTPAFTKPLFRLPIWHGREAFERVDVQDVQNPDQGVFGKKVVVLAGPSTVSYGEVVADTIRDASSPVRVKLVGRNTAGTAGNPSGIKLPGGFNFGFTSIEMLHADGKTVFEGVGLAPDVTAAPTQQDLASGVDTELAAGVATLDAM